MATMNVGNRGESVRAAGEAICEVLRVGFETHAEQDTIQEALQTLAKSSATNLTLTGNTTLADTINYTLDLEDDADDSDS